MRISRSLLKFGLGGLSLLSLVALDAIQPLLQTLRTQ